MTDKIDTLIDGFAFDAWANRQWWEYIQNKSLDDPDRTIFAHMLAAQKIWSLRVEGAPPSSMPIVVPSLENILELNQEWITHLKARSDDPLIHYKRLDGTPQHLRLGQIARHVIDHGTYHRGELRGLCRARNSEDFPETGLALYYLTRGEG